MPKPLYLTNAPEHLQDLHDEVARLRDRAFDLRQNDVGADLGAALTDFQRALATRRPMAPQERQTPTRDIPFRGAVT